jgi:antitoxin component of MazEF toxin-antitoxin module
MMAKLNKRKTRKIFKTGDSFGVTIPREIIRKFNWKNKQKLEVELRGSSVVIKEAKEDDKIKENKAGKEVKK